MANKVKDLNYIVAAPRNKQRCNKCRIDFSPKKVIVARIHTWFIQYEPTVILCERCFVNHILQNEDVTLQKILYKGEDLKIEV